MKILEINCGSNKKNLQKLYKKKFRKFRKKMEILKENFRKKFAKINQLF